MQRLRSIRATQRCDPQRPKTTIARAGQTKDTFPARLNFFPHVAIDYNTGYEGRERIVYQFLINNNFKTMNNSEKKIFAYRIMSKLNNNPQIRVADVASLLYINKGKARRILDWMVCQGYINKKTIKYAGNANMNVYSKK